MDAVLLALASAVLFGATTVACGSRSGPGASRRAGRSSRFSSQSASCCRSPWWRAASRRTCGRSWSRGCSAPGLAVPVHVRRPRGGRRADLGRHRHGAAVLDRHRGRILGEALEAASRRRVADRRRRVPSSASEAGRSTVRRLGLACALVATIVFAARDNLIRWLAVDTDVAPGVAAGPPSPPSGSHGVFVLVGRARRCALTRAALAAGVLFGLSYVCLFEAYYRGRSRSSRPWSARSRWGWRLQRSFLHRTERPVHRSSRRDPRRRRRSPDRGISAACGRQSATLTLRFSVAPTHY